MTRDARLRTGALALLSLAGLAAVSGCAIAPSGNSVCTDPGPNNPGWPYCAPAEPGGPGPVDDPIDPTGRGVPN